MSANVESMFYAGREKPWHGRWSMCFELSSPEGETLMTTSF